MNCKYCNKECIEHPVLKGLLRFECIDCAANFFTLVDGGLLYISFKEILVNDRKYYIKLYDGVSGNAPEIVIYWYTFNSEGHGYWEEVKRFDFVPKDWTPQNVVHKLKTYLPFL